MPIINKLPQGGGSGKAKLNIFTQLAEPETKEGIWLKTSENYDRVIVDNSTYLSGTILTSTSPEFPIGYDFNVTGNGILDYDSSTNSMYILKTDSTTVIQKFNISTKTLVRYNI